MLKRFYTIAQAAEFLRRSLGNQDTDDTDVLRMAANGTLGICFQFRGLLGLFPEPPVVPTGQISSEQIYPVPLKTAFFDGYLRSVSGPRLRDEIERISFEPAKRPTKSTAVVDTLCPVRVTIADIANHKLLQVDPAPPGHYWGRLKEAIHMGHGRLDQPKTILRTAVSPDQWLVHVDDLMAIVPIAQDSTAPPVNIAGTSGQTEQPSPTVPAGTAPCNPATGAVETALKPLPSNTIANCFAGLRGWELKRWKAELGSPDQWLEDCRCATGTKGRGGLQSTWWPVAIAAALVKNHNVSPKLLSHRFKKQDPLKPWLDIWEPHDPDSFE
jgi:hypothetical protein